MLQREATFDALVRPWHRLSAILLFLTPGLLHQITRPLSSLVREATHTSARSNCSPRSTSSKLCRASARAFISRKVPVHTVPCGVKLLHHELVFWLTVRIMSSRTSTCDPSAAIDKSAGRTMQLRLCDLQWLTEGPSRNVVFSLLTSTPRWAQELYVNKVQIANLLRCPQPSILQPNKIRTSHLCPLQVHGLPSFPESPTFQPTELQHSTPLPIMSPPTPDIPINKLRHSKLMPSKSPQRVQSKVVFSTLTSTDK